MVYDEEQYEETEIAEHVPPCPGMLLSKLLVQPVVSHRFLRRHSTKIVKMGVHNTRISHPRRSRVDGIALAVRLVHISTCFLQGPG